jgi:transposase-like protein
VGRPTLFIRDKVNLPQLKKKLNKIKRKKRTFNDDFKYQIISLYQHGKSRGEIVAEYNLTPSAWDRWIM